MPDITNDALSSTPRGKPRGTDTGKTSGGGSLGHDQPEDVQRETPLRNNTGSEDDPVMPEDDSTLNTKI